MKRLAELFWSFFKISLLVIGGGYAIIAVADETFARKGWTKEGELVDRLPVFQMIPGLLALHTAVYVGNRVAGALGALIAAVAIAIPSISIFLAVSAGYRSLPLGHPVLASVFIGLRASLTGIIAATVLRSWLRAKKDGFFLSLAALGTVAIGLLGVSVPLVLVVAMVCGLVAEQAKDGTRRYESSGLPLLVFLKYGLLSFGGGFVLVPMYLQDFVGPQAPYLQLPEETFSNVMALTQMTPGPIGINAATFFGYRLAGLPGSLVASLLLVLPGALLAFAVFRSLDAFQSNRFVRGLLRGVRPASLALMLVALWTFARISFVSIPAPFIAVGCAVLLHFKKLSAVRLILLSGLIAPLSRLLG